MPKKTEPVVEVDEAEAKKQRKLAKRAAKEAAAAEEEEAPVPEKKAKKSKKAAEAEEVAAAEEEVDPAEAKRQRKAAKKAAKEAAAAAEVEEAAGEEIDEAEAKKQRKAAKKAAKKAAEEAAEDEEEEPPKKSKKKKQAEEDDAEEAPPAKKSKTEAADTNGTTADAEKTLKVFVKGLPYSITEDTLRKDFEECGAIERLQFPYNDDGSPRGFAFITYVAQEGVDKALKFDGTDYGGRNIGVALANEKGKGKGKDGKGGKDGGGKGGKDNTNTVFIRGLPFSATEESLNKDFAECGEVETLRVPLNEEGRPKGICFVKYKTQEGVDAALKFDNTEYGGRTIYVLMAGDGKGDGKGKDGKGKGKDAKDGKGKDGKGKGKKGKKGKAPSEAFAKSSGAIVESTGEKKTFEDSDSE